MANSISYSELSFKGIYDKWTDQCVTIIQPKPHKEKWEQAVYKYYMATKVSYVFKPFRV